MKKSIPAYMWVISRDSSGAYIVSIGDPYQSNSTLVRRFRSKADLKDWVKYDMPELVSPKHVYDTVGVYNR